MGDRQARATKLASLLRHRELMNATVSVTPSRIRGVDALLVQCSLPNGNQYKLTYRAFTDLGRLADNAQKRILAQIATRDFA